MIRFKNFSFSYKKEGEYQLKNINFTVKEGEFVLLCGSSASGKTTVTKCVNGLIPHCTLGRCEGEVWVKGRMISQTPTYTIAEYVGSVFQNPKTQFFNLDTYSELVFGLENFGIEKTEIKKRVDSVIEDLDLEDFRNRKVFELSVGEKQILALASVYALNPDIYVLDEPTANMDAKAVERLHNILRKIKEQGKTVLISEHRLYFLMDLLDRAVYIENGSIKRIYQKNEFEELSLDEREKLKLRCFALPCFENKVLCSNRNYFLKADNLTVKLGGRVLLKNINFGMNLGDIVAVTGENGVGKTELLRVLCGLSKEEQGKIYVENKKISYKKRRKYCTMTMQDVVHQLFSDCVWNEVATLNKNVSQQEISHLLEELDLLEYKEHHPMTLSGGQKQRLVLLGAFLLGRKIMLFDEPTSGLDYENMLKVCKLIQRISDERVIFIATHDRELISKVCNKELVLENKTIKLYEISQKFKGEK